MRTRAIKTAEWLENRREANDAVDAPPAMRSVEAETLREGLGDRLDLCATRQR